MQLYWWKCTNYYNFTSAALHAPMVKMSHNSGAILSDFFKLSYIIQLYMYYPQIHYSNYAFESKVQKNALKLMQLYWRKCTNYYNFTSACCMHLWLKRPITQPLFCLIFFNFHILYSLICTIHRCIIQIMHLSKKYRKMHLNSCNFTGGNALISIISLVRLCMHLWLKCPITQALFCPIFLNFHIL